jgi:hypothetical protein
MKRLSIETLHPTSSSGTNETRLIDFEATTGN